MATIDFGGSKLVPPKPFNGNVELWEDWSWTFRMYVAAMNNTAVTLLDDAERHTTQILDATFNSITDDAQRARTLALSRQLHYLLANLTEGPAKTIVRNNTLNNGLETWRRLCNKFALPGATRHIGLLSTILGFTFNNGQFESDFDRWEALKLKYETQTSTTLPDSVLIALLLSKTTGSLQEHLRLQLSALDTYDKFRNVMVNYFRSSHVLNQTTFGDPMDVGNIDFNDGWYYDDALGWCYQDSTVNAFWRKIKGKGK